MRVYQINWRVFIDDLLLISFRKPFWRAWLWALLAPVRKLHSRFLGYREDALYRVRHNSQIAYMEAVLNDKYDPAFRRIRIQNVSFRDPIYFYEPEENKEVWFYEPEDNKPVYFHEADSFVGDGVDFVVCVPPDLRPSNPAQETALTTRMKGQIDYYKLYSKNYEIQWVLIED